MNQVILSKNAMRSTFYLTPTLMLTIYLSLTSDKVFWYSTLITVFIMSVFYAKDKNKTYLLCRFDEGVLFFPSLGRQLKTGEIDKIEVAKSKLPFYHTIKIYSNAYQDDILTLRTFDKQDVGSMVKLFKTIGIDDNIMAVKM